MNNRHQGEVGSWCQGKQTKASLTKIESKLPSSLADFISSNTSRSVLLWWIQYRKTHRWTTSVPCTVCMNTFLSIYVTQGALNSKANLHVDFCTVQRLTGRCTDEWDAGETSNITTMFPQKFASSHLLDQLRARFEKLKWFFCEQKKTPTRV